MNRAIFLGAAVIGATLTQGALAESWDLSCGFLGSWSQRVFPWSHDGCLVNEAYPDLACGGMTWMPHPGRPDSADYGPPADSEQTQCTYTRVGNANAALAVMLRCQNGPIPYNDNEWIEGAPDTLDIVLDTVPDLKFVMMAFEAQVESFIEANIEAVRDILHDANREDMYWGNYLWYPGEYEASAPNRGKADRTDEHAAYMASGMNVALPSCYPFDNQGRRHADPRCFSGAAPNLESAMFWAPLERMSTASRALPPGHLLIPFVSPYNCKSPCEAPPPTPATLKALMQHFRLRGAHGLITNPGRYEGPDLISEEQFDEIVLNAWSSLDHYFDTASELEFLNLNTVKTTGVEWSGIMTDRYIVILTTNLGPINRPYLELPPLPGLPATIPVPQGHRLRVWELEGAQVRSADFNSDGWVNNIDLSQLMIAFGLPCASCVEDLDEDAAVETDDLVMLLQQWGRVN